MNTFSERRKLAKGYEQWLQENPEVKDCALSVITYLDIIDRLKIGWIPIENKMPLIYADTNTSDIVLVQGYDAEIDYYWQAMGYYAEEPKQWFFAECKNTDKPIDWIDIIAWQPLPEDYKKEK